MFEKMHDGAILPEVAHLGDAGWDLHADKPVTIAPGEYALVPTGVRALVPQGCVGLVCPRSGLAAKHGVTVLNAPGVVDSGYTGEVGVLLVNHGAQDFVVAAGDRIAQMVFLGAMVTVEMPSWPFDQPSEEALAAQANGERGDKGFGSTGV